MISRIYNVYTYVCLSIVAMAALASCSEDDFVVSEQQYHDAVLIKCAVADYITEESDMTRGLTRGMSYDDNMITKLDLLIFEKNGLLKHLTTEISETGKYTWDITGQMPKDYLKNKNVAIYLIANYYPSDHDGKQITDFNPSNANTFFAVTSINPFPPGEMLNHGIVMSQVMEGTKYYTTDGNNNLIMNFNNLERVMAKAEFFVATFDDLTLDETIDFEDANTFTDGWVSTVPGREIILQGEKTINSETRYFLNAIHKEKNDNGVWNNGVEYYYTITNEKFKSSNSWRMEFDFAGLRSNQYNGNSQNPALKINNILSIGYNNNPQTSETATWTFDNGENSSTTAAVANGTMTKTTFEKGNNITITGYDDITYIDANGDSQTERMTKFTTVAKHNNASEATANGGYLVFKATPAANIGFTPTKLSFKSSKSGTGGGAYNIIIKRGSESKTLMNGYSPERRSEGTINVDLTKVTNLTGVDGKYADANQNLDCFKHNETASIPFTTAKSGKHKISFKYATVRNDVSVTVKIKDSDNNELYSEDFTLPATTTNTNNWHEYKTKIGTSESSSLTQDTNYKLEITFKSANEQYTANIKDIKFDIENDNDGMNGSNDAGTEISISEFDISDMTSSNEEVEIWFYIYSLDPGKPNNLSDITLTGNVDKSNWTGKEATVYFGDKTGNITLDCRTANEYYDNAVKVSTWYHLDMISDGTNITCQIKDSNGNSVFNETMPDNYATPSEIRMILARYNSHWAIDDIKLYASTQREITEYKVQNYTNGYTLFNIGDVDKSTTTEIYNKTENKYENTDFTLMTNHPESLIDAENNSFAFYFYPNYWFDLDKATKMHQAEPIIPERQTHVLVKASYQDKEYYYKVPVNFRLPKYSDAHAVSNHFDSKIDDICDRINYTDGDGNSALATEMLEYIINYLYYTYETCSEEDEILDACDELIDKAVAARNSKYNELVDVAVKAGKDPYTDEELMKKIKKEAVEAAKTAVKAWIGGSYIYIVFKKKNETEAERLCRIQRNHHYKITVNIDKPGGETVDEAVYIMPAPYGDITARPEF